ncbi:MAG: hypothetical protein IKD03_05170, partial [Clostridia bacterium]|nr:hypothetical protein [Clostridia bacterium]
NRNNICACCNCVGNRTVTVCFSVNLACFTVGQNNITGCNLLNILFGNRQRGCSSGCLSYHEPDFENLRKV